MQDKKNYLSCKLLLEDTGRCDPPMEGHKPRKKWNTGKPEIYKKKGREEVSGHRPREVSRRQLCS